VPRPIPASIPRRAWIWQPAQSVAMSFTPVEIRDSLQTSEQNSMLDIIPQYFVFILLRFGYPEV